MFARIVMVLAFGLLVGCGSLKTVEVEAFVKEKTCADLAIDGQMSRADCRVEMVRTLKEASHKRDDKQIEGWLVAMTQHALGVEMITTVFHRLLVHDEEARYFDRRMNRTLDDETRDHVYARAYFAALASNDGPRSGALNRIVNGLPAAEKMQIIGYALFLNSGENKSDYRGEIVEEAHKLGLKRESFDSMSDEISRLKAKLDEVVIGQEGAKIALAVAIRNHYEGLRQGLPKSNILILGPSGTGKTLMVQTIANSLDVPFAVFDASSITQAGYIGGKVKDAVMALAQKAEFNQEKIERGIIFFDEIDKMAARGGRGDSEEFKRQAQATLLKVIEGIEVEVKENEHRKLNIDTSKILFVCAGAFSGLNLSSKVSTDDLIAFGMMPELLGRLPNMITLHELGVSDLERILKNPRSSVLEEYKTRFAAQKIALKFTDGATRAIAEKAAEFRIGARALKTVVARVMADLQFRIGNMGHIQSCTVTERVIRYGDLPLITYR